MKVAGIHPVEELLRGEKKINEIYVAIHSRSPAIKTLISQLQQKNIPIKYVPREKLNKLYRGNHQGIVAVIAPLEYADLDEMIARAFQRRSNPYFLLLDGVTDARNLGAIIRSAAAFEADGIILPAHGSAPLNEDVVRMSAGGIFHVPVARVNHLLDAVYALKQHDAEIIASTGYADEALEQYRFTRPVGLIMGSEQKGVGKSLLRQADKKLKISISPQIESLNVSVATAVFLYEIHKQLRLQ